MKRSKQWLAAACLALGLAAAVAAGTSQSAGKRVADRKPWWTHATIYEIYVRSFQDTNGDGIGDLKGITSRLDYLQRLGVDALWLTPFYPSPNADFGYDIADYTGVAPEYGTMADWDELVREADRRGIHLLVDFVLNHSSDQHPWFKESRSSRDNPKRDWYVWHDGKPGNLPPSNWESIFGGPAWTYDAATKQWYYHIFMDKQPDLNWANPKLRKAMMDVARFWLQHGASGFRLDATPYLFEDPAFPDDPDPKAGAPVWLKPYNSQLPGTNDVLRELRRVVDGYPGNPMLLGESATASIPELLKVYGEHDDEIHLPMDFLYGNLTKLDPAAFKKQSDDAQLALEGHVPVLFLSSHDHPRQWSVFGDGVHNDQIARITSALTTLQGGVALLYYGEELGMPTVPAEALKAAPLGPKRPRIDDRDGERTPMQWSAAENAGFTTGTPWLPASEGYPRVNAAAQMADANSLLSWYQRLLALRRNEPAFRDGQYLALETGSPSVIAFARSAGKGQGAVVVLNMSNSEQGVTLAGLPAEARFGTVLMASPAAMTPASSAFKVAPWGVVVASFGGRH
jgi:alpha-glucosidase